MRLYTLIFLAAVFLACSNGSPPATTPGVMPAAVQNGKAEVVFQGLIAFVKGDEMGPVFLDALLVDANEATKDTGNIPRIVDPFSLPRKVTPAAALKNRFIFPEHIPYIAVSNARFEPGCFIRGSAREFRIPVDGGHVAADAYPLCSGSSSRCERDIEVGFSVASRPIVKLDALTAKSDFDNEYHCQAGFFKIRRGNVQERLSSRVRIKGGYSIIAREVRDDKKRLDRFGFCALSGGIEERSKGVVSMRLAEEVAVEGQGNIILSMGARQCAITPILSEKEMKVWILNAYTESYLPPPAGISNLKTHHEAFYWFYDLAPTSCRAETELYPRPCASHEIQGESNELFFGYPKCPQPLMEYTD